MEIKRGQIFMVDLGMDNKVGSEQKGFKPVVVLQNNVGNKFSTTVIVAVITSKQKTRIPTHLEIHESVGMPRKSYILCEQIFTISKDRLKEYVTVIEDVKQLDIALRISLGL